MTTNRRTNNIKQKYISLTLILHVLITSCGAVNTIDLNVTRTAIENARLSIIDVSTVFWITNGTNLAAKFLRLSFHDAVGGSDGCVDMSSPDNAGLEIPIDALRPIVAQYATRTTGLSRADIWALAGLTGAEISRTRLLYNIISTPIHWPRRLQRFSRSRSCLRHATTRLDCVPITAFLQPQL